MHTDDFDYESRLDEIPAVGDGTPRGFVHQSEFHTEETGLNISGATPVSQFADDIENVE